MVGQFYDRGATARSILHSRAIVLKRGAISWHWWLSTTVSFPVLGQQKQAAEVTGIRTDRMLVSATHTFAPASQVGRRSESRRPVLRETGNR